MASGGLASRWVSLVYFGVAVVVVIAVILAAYLTGSRTPERQAKRWGLVQLQAIRQARDHIRQQIAYLEQGIRVLSTSPTLSANPIDESAAEREVQRAFSALEIEGLHVQRFGSAGTLMLEFRPQLFASESRYRGEPADLDEIMAWTSDPQNRGRVLATLERLGGESASDTRLMARYVIGIWSAPVREEKPSPSGFLLVRFPVKEFLASRMLAAQLVPETYSFVIESARTLGDTTLPASVLWHFRNPRWADDYLSDTDPFVTAITGQMRFDQDELYAIVDVPQADGAMRREIVSMLPMMFGDRRWIFGLGTPYGEAVMSTREQQSLLLLMGGLTVALLLAGVVLMRYQRARMEWEAMIERRAQLERMGHNYQELFAENPTAMIVLRPDGSIVDCNLSAEVLLASSTLNAKGRRLHEFFEGDGIDDLWEKLTNLSLLPATDARVVRRVDHRSTLIEAWGRRIGEQLVLMVQDVERRRDFDRQMARLRRMDSVGSLASTLAHDFNNLLGQVQILVSNLRSDLAADSPLHEDLSAIEDKIDDASRLVGDLLSFRENVLSDVPIDPEPILQEFVHQQRRILPERVRLLADIRADLPSIWLSPTSLRRLLDNLVRNAVDAMPEGGTVTLRARGQWIDPREATDQLRADLYCVIEVADTGVGMSQEILDAIFEPYFTTKKDGQGTGLGLWTIYKIIRRVRGAVHVHSKPGEGTRFTLYLSHSRPTEDIDTPGLEMARPNR